MSGHRKEVRRTNRRAFRPSLENETLETRLLLSGKTSRVPDSVFLRNPRAGVAFKFNNPQFLSSGAPRFPVANFPRGNKIATQTAHGGQSVVVAAPDGSHFKVSLTQFIPPAGQGQAQTSTGSNSPGTQNPIQGVVPGATTVQPTGTVRAYAMSGGRVGLIVDGTTTQSELDISPLPFPQRKGYAHSFAYGQSNQSHVLNVGQLTVTSGEIGAILGFHTADLSGPLTTLGPTAVDRIAFNNLLPGASIQTGGDLNTLDVLNNITLDSGPGIVVKRDLNLLNVGQDMSLSNGASIVVGRFLGATPQPPKGTGTGSNIVSLNQALVGSGTSTLVPAVSGYVQGDVTLGAGSLFAVANGVASSSIIGTNSENQPITNPSVFLVNGSVTVDSPQLSNQLIAPAANPFIFATNIGEVVNGQVANFLARSGFSPPTP